MKKLFCLLISVSLILTCSFVPISAEEKTKYEDNDYAEYINYENVIPETIEYTAPIYSNETLISDNNENIVYNLAISSIEMYNEIEVNYASTLNITLDDYSTDIFNYSKDLTIPITFSTAVDNSLKSDYKATEFEKIIITYTVISKGISVETKCVELSVLVTSNGVFVGNVGNMSVYDTYINYLKFNNLIDDITFSSLQQTMTSLSNSSVYNEQSSTDYPTSKYKQNNIILKCLNNSKSDIAFTTYQSYYNQNATNRAASTKKSSTYHAPIVKVTRTIESLNNGAQLRVYGEVSFTTVDSNTVFHKMKRVKVEVFDDNLISDTCLGYAYTNNAGGYSITVNNDTGFFEGGYDIYVKVSTVTNDFNIVSHGALSTYASGYYVTTSVTQNVKGNVGKVESSGSGDNVHKAFLIHQALVAGYYYYNEMTSDNSTNCTIYYPGNADTSNAIFSTAQINIYSTDFWSWDVVLHELGHIAQYQLGAVGSFGKSHIITENLIERYGKSLGIQGSWNEGWPTYFCITSQLYYNSNSANVSSIFTAADSIYSSSSSISGTTYSYYNYNITDNYKMGEGNEMAIAQCLFLFVHDNSISLDDQDLWNATNNSNATNFSQFMAELYTEVDASLISPIGTILSNCMIADNVLSNTSSIKDSSIPPALIWEKAAPSDTLTYSFKVIFRDEDYNIIYESPLQDRNTMSTTLQTSINQWSTIVNGLDTGIGYWGLATYQNGSPNTGPYYSPLSKIVLSDDIQELTDPGTAYTATLEAGHEKWFSFTAPTNGTYTFYSANSIDDKALLFTSNILEDNLAQQSDDDSGGSYNFSITRTISAGSTIYLKVQGYSKYVSGTINIYFRQN